MQASCFSTFEGLRAVPKSQSMSSPSSTRRDAKFFVDAKKESTRRSRRLERHRRIRRKLSGTPDRPRLCVFRSNKHMYAQVIDDIAGHTMVTASTLTPEVKTGVEGKGATKDAATEVGKKVAEMCLEQGIDKVAFDRAGYMYHGRVEAVADGAREAGLQF